LIFQRLIPVLFLRTLATSSRGLKKDYPWSDYLEKLPDPSNTYGIIRKALNFIFDSRFLIHKIECTKIAVLRFSIVRTVYRRLKFKWP
jgi:hypothetical protein